MAGGCCAFPVVHYVWGQSFTLSYGIQLQPLPPNTGMSLVANVAGTTRADDVFWADNCKSIPSNTLFIVVTMGSIRDFFRPTNGVTFCEMLLSNTKHEWSKDGLSWTKPTSYNYNFGGSAGSWPRGKGHAGDERTYLSFWGTNFALTGGCCSTSTAVAVTRPSLPGNGVDNPIWGQSCTSAAHMHTGPSFTPT